MKISACVITKNEEKNIGKWLHEMSSIADEMIVVDTGSADNTVNMAKRAGANVYHFEWTNDFAAAKNYAIEQATGDWILFLDADEYFSEETKDNLRPLLKKYYLDKNVGSIRCRLTNIDIDNNDKIIDAMVQVRVFKNIPQIRYRGKIHENIFNSGNNIGMAFSNKLEILHTGYSSSIIKSKSERNLKILLEKRKIEGDSFDVIAGCMDAYMTLEQYEEAYKYAQMSIRKDMQYFGLEGHDYVILIHSLSMLVSQKLESFDTLINAINDAIDKFSEEPYFYLAKGYLLYQQKDYVNAKKSLEKGLEVRLNFEKKCAEGLGLNDISKRMLPMAYEALGNIYILRQNYKKAADNFATGIGIYKYYAPNLIGLCNCIKDAATVDIIHVINLYYNINKDCGFICETLKYTDKNQIYEYYIRRGGMSVDNSVESLLAYGYYQSAAIKAADKLRREYNIDKLCLKYSNISNSYLEMLLPKKYKKTSRDMNLVLDRLSREIGSLRVDCVEKPLVSIMIPTYNRPIMFEKTLKSALSQTYENVEILVNDNSTNDETECLIQKYLGDSRLRYFRNYKAKSKEANFAPFERQARGSILQWCMDDDILASNKLEIMVPILRDDSSVTLVSSMRGFIDENDNNLNNTDSDNIITRGACNEADGDSIGRYMLTEVSNLIGEPSAVLFRKKDLTHHYWKAESKGFFAISDVAMWLELLEKGKMVLFTEPLSFYRKNINQEGQIPEVSINSRLEWLQLIEEYYYRKVFLKSDGDYKKALFKLYNEYKNYFGENSKYNSSKYIVAKNFIQYKHAMLGIAEKLNEL